MKKYIFLLIISFLILPALSVHAEAIQIDSLLSGMRNPSTDEPLNGGLVYTYVAGTSTPISLYIDREETTNAPNPIELDAYGRAIVFGNGIYRFIVKDASGTIVWSADGLEYKGQITSSGLGPLTEDLGAAGFKITTLGNPDDNGDATNKLYVDTKDGLLQDNIDALSNTVATLTFKDLVDTPLSYSGAGGYVLVVGGSEDKVVFEDIENVMPTPATQAYPIGDAGGDLDGTYPDPSVAKIQGVLVSTSTPSINQVLTYDGSKWVASPVPGGLTRYDAFTGFSNSVTINQGVDYTGTPLYASVVYDFAGDCVSMFDVAQTASVGYYRIVNRGGEQADRNYDGVLYVSTTGTSITFSGRYVKSVIVYCQ